MVVVALMVVAGLAAACGEVYSTVVNTIPLGPGFESGETYTVAINSTKTFVAQ